MRYSKEDNGRASAPCAVFLVLFSTVIVNAWKAIEVVHISRAAMPRSPAPMTGPADLAAPLPEDVEDALPLVLAWPAALRVWLILAVMLPELVVAVIVLFLVEWIAAFASRKLAHAMAAERVLARLANRGLTMALWWRREKDEPPVPSAITILPWPKNALSLGSMET